MLTIIGLAKTNFTFVAAQNSAVIFANATIGNNLDESLGAVYNVGTIKTHREGGINYGKKIKDKV